MHETQISQHKYGKCSSKEKEYSQLLMAKYAPTPPIQPPRPRRLVFISVLSALTSRHARDKGPKSIKTSR